MHFASPFYLLTILAIIPYLFFRYFSRRRLLAINLPVFAELKTAFGVKRINWQVAEDILAVLLIVVLAIALARPQSSHQKENIGKKGIDIIIALDVSDSMRAEDLKPNRLAAAKESLNKFISRLHDDRLGIIVFAGTAFTQSPLTFDYNILKEYINRISTQTINQNVRGLNGTAIGDAILAALNRFKNSGDRSKVLLLLTDGDANTGVDPILAAKRAREKGVKIYAIGIGKKGGAPLPISDMLGRKTYARNPDGSLFKATFNEENLKKIAALTGGQYFRAGDNASFDKVMNEINSLEKREIKINTTTEYTDNFQYFLYLAVCLLIPFLLIRAYKKGLV